MKATSFATIQDLRGFIAESLKFLSRETLAGLCAQITPLLTPDQLNQCLEKGDNGVGKWNDPTWQPDASPPIVALPLPHAPGTMVKVTLQGGQPFTAECKDRSPHDVVDLAPSALQAAGLGVDDQLLTSADVELLD